MIEIHKAFFSSTPPVQTYHHEIHARRKDGSAFILSLSVNRFHADKEILYSAILRDITEVKKTERIKNEIISIVSHELRTPITSIRGALSMAAGPLKAELSERTEKLVTIAHRNSERLVRIVNDILDIEKLLAGKLVIHREVVSLDPFLRQTVDDIGFIGADRGVGIVLGTVVDAPVLADPDRLTQVIVNLLSNAIKFSPDNANVHVYTENRGPFVRFFVRDTGIGIPTEFRGRIFQRFSQADSSSTRRYVGAGLGLSIAKDLVEAMGGRLDFFSQVGKGSTFFFDIPKVT